MFTVFASFLRRAVWLAAIAAVLAACSSTSNAAWTYVPPAGTPPPTAGASGAPPSGAPSPGAPSGSAEPGATGAASPGASGGGSATTIELVETASLTITDPNGTQVTSLTVKKGQTYHFKITNSAGFTHNFYVGKVSDLEASATANLTGTGDFGSGTREFDYTFSDDSTPLGFGCLVPGHYQAGMKGTFTVQP